MRHALWILAWSLSAAACASENGGPSGDGGTGGAAGAAGAAGYGGAQCSGPTGNLWVSVSPNPATDGGTAIDWSATGKVVASAKNQLTLDECAPGASCSPTLRELTITAYQLDFVAPVGAFVEAHFVIGPTGGYMNPPLTLGIRNVPSWGGTDNPVATTSHWYLLLADGVLANPDAPFEVTATPVACWGGAQVELAFGAPGQAPIPVAVNQVVSLELAGQKWNASVVRAHQPACCDYPAPYAWWFESAEE
ncbi:MAG: hypothetical protein HS104_02920 [Polyangiaceae bacterium]|nr:hypothetical protein [Polyangiaceae bacterium]MCE7891259.1 hypothetical protein [Sorangiineae bacterium PRO1]MCL4754883.1 hypothetical protein [Myxococcales bacterium]